MRCEHEGHREAQLVRAGFRGPQRGPQPTAPTRTRTTLQGSCARFQREERLNDVARGVPHASSLQLARSCASRRCDAR